LKFDGDGVFTLGLGGRAAVDFIFGMLARVNLRKRKMLLFSAFPGLTAWAKFVPRLRRWVASLEKEWVRGDLVSPSGEPEVGKFSVIVFIGPLNPAGYWQVLLCRHLLGFHLLTE